MSFKLNIVFNKITAPSKCFFIKIKNKPNSTKILNKSQICITKMFTLF